MCGITGIISPNKALEKNLIREMTESLRHRGPDDEGYLGISLASGTEYEFFSSESVVKKEFDLRQFDKRLEFFLGHRRLSIVDLSPAGHQPMSYSNGELWIIFNGEIFNYLELKQELMAKGYGFASRTDTEVILAAYSEWGQHCVKHFNGDWALAVYDKKNRLVFLSRDRYGIKPLYYHFDQGEKVFCFASEIKALCKLPWIGLEPNYQKASEYIVFGLMDHTQETLYENIYQIEPGSNLVIHLEDLTIEKQKYYSLQYNPDFGRYDQKKAVSYASEIKDLLFDSVRIRLRADVPIGTCLSGGIDSSTIVSIINRLIREEGVAPVQIGERQLTFTSSFPNDPVDESFYAKIMLEHTKARGIFIEPSLEGYREEVKDLFRQQDEPYGGLSVYAQYKVFERASQDVKVILDGQGSDEIFAGYDSYRGVFLAQLLRGGAMINFFKELFSTVGMYKSTREALGELRAAPLYVLPSFLSRRLYLNERHRKYHGDLLKLKLPADTVPEGLLQTIRPNLNEILFWYQTKFNLPLLLHYEDRNSMSFSLESRTPYTDFRLVDYLYSLPACYKIHKGWSKWLLRLAVEDLLPEEIVWRKDKIGFAVPRGYEGSDRRFNIYNDWLDFLKTQ